MILMTLKTICFPFDRAIFWLKILPDWGAINEPVFSQYRTSDISSLAENPLVRMESTAFKKYSSLCYSNSGIVISAIKAKASFT